MLRHVTLSVVLAFLTAACTTVRETMPSRTATEQLLVTTAAERAVEALDLDIPEGTRVFVDASYVEGPDGKYALATIRDRLLRRGARLAPDRARADAVVELRVGALSIDDRSTLLGIPRMDMPVPLTGAVPVPEVALFKKHERRGVARLAATAYDSEGRLIDSSDPRFGQASVTERVVLLFFAWRRSDLPRAPSGRWTDRF